jgi:hypothetical protein
LACDIRAIRERQQRGPLAPTRAACEDLTYNTNGRGPQELHLLGSGP